MSRYKHLFFDLDRTLWDFEKNSKEKFRKIYTKFDLRSRGVPSWEDFRSTFTKHNDLLWGYYRKGLIRKEKLSVKRFELTLQDYNNNDLLLASEIADEYLTITSRDVYLFPHTEDVLEYLYDKYILHLITNGFEEVQVRKVDISGLARYFKTFTTSEEAGVKKPDPGIFLFALRKAGAEPRESIMIGDDLEVDILGAREVDMDQIYVNYKGVPHSERIGYEVSDLLELKKIF